MRIPPDAEPGLYWYHPHAHGETYHQITGGMAGALVVEGLAQHLPGLAHLRERIVVLRDGPVGAGPLDEDMPRNMAGMSMLPAAPRAKRSADNPCRAEDGLLPTLNRQAHAKIGIHAGEEQLFRVLNASAARYFDLSIDGALLELVALDGVPLDAYPGTAPTRTVRHLVLPPRARELWWRPARRTVLRSAATTADRG